MPEVLQVVIDEPEMRRRLGIALQAARLHVGMKQVEVSLASGVHRATIARAERGAHRLSLQHLDRLATAMRTKSWVILRTAEEKVT